MGVLLTLIIVYLTIGIALSTFACIMEWAQFTIRGFVQMTLLWPVAVTIILLIYFGKISML